MSLKNVENNILLALREKFIAYNGEDLLYKENDIVENAKIKTDKKIFYCKDYIFNLFNRKLSFHKNEYKTAQGRELSTNNYGLQKMAALKSSSALIFNTLGDEEQVEILDNKLLGYFARQGMYFLKYEQPLRTLKFKNGMIETKAYIDGLLQNDNHIILVENKMLEYLSEGKSLKKNYLNEECYYNSLIKENCL